VYHRRQGDALHPQREPIEILEEIKRQMGSLNFSAQYQQMPVPPEGNLVKRRWIEWYDSAPSRGDGERWSRLSEQLFRVDKWSLCRG
jgi:hypothetical protein